LIEDEFSEYGEIMELPHGEKPLRVGIVEAMMRCKVTDGLCRSEDAKC